MKTFVKCKYQALKFKRFYHFSLILSDGPRSLQIRDFRAM
jgi:hypothetical protein